MMDPEELPAELLWADGDHASDVVLTALADGQHAIVPLAVRDHVARCSTCMAHLGHSALLSLETRRLLRVVAHESVARRPVPRVAVAFGLVAAAIGLVPWLVAGDGPGPVRAVSTLTRGLATFATRLDALPIAVTYVAATCLVLAGLALARLSPRLSPKKEVS